MPTYAILSMPQSLPLAALSSGQAYLAVDGECGSFANDDRVLTFHEVVRDTEDTGRHLFEFNHRSEDTYADGTPQGARCLDHHRGRLYP